MAESLVIFTIAVLLHALSGKIPRSLNRRRPLFDLPARVTLFLMQKLDRAGRRSASLQIRGLITLLIVLVLCILLGYGAERLAVTLPQGWIIPLGLTITALRFSWPWRALPKMRLVVEANQLGMSAELTMIITHNRLAGFPALKQPDRYGLLRFACGSAAGSLVRGLFALLIGGLLATALQLPWLVGLCCVVGLSEFVQLTVTASPAFRRLGVFLNSLIQKLAQFPAAFCIVIAAMIVPRCHPLKALQLGLLHSFDPRALFAGALNVTLAGPSEGTVWFGGVGASSRLNSLHIGGALWLHVVSILVAIALCSGLVYGCLTL